MSPSVTGPSCGIISAENATAAGALMNETISTWPIASGTTGARMMPYNTITVPAMPAMPPAMVMNNSPRDNFAR